MDFQNAINALKNGKMVKRSTWPYEGFVFMQIPSEIKGEIVPKMQSLPQSVKDLFQKRFESETHQINSIYYADQFGFVNSSNLITGWSPTPSDTLAVDWVIFQ